MNEQKLYKIDSKNKTRVWWIEIQKNAYRVHSGILNGKIVTSGWKYAEPKNVGKKNETTAEEQCLLEVKSKYKNQIDFNSYTEKLGEISNNISPMLANKYNSKKSVFFPVFSQPKLDGIRCLITKKGMFSRKGKEFLGAPFIYESLFQFFEKYPFAILDGEIYNHSLKNNFNKLQSLITKKALTQEDLKEAKEIIEFHVYDAMVFGSFEERYNFVKDNLSFEQEYIKLVDTTYITKQDELDKLYSDYIEQGYEGQMIRLPNCQYENKRSKFLLKRKEMLDDEFEIVSINEGIGNWAGFAKSVTIKLKDGREQLAGLRGTQEEMQNLLNNANDYVGGTVTVNYQNFTPDNKLRFPIVTKYYVGERNY